MGADLSEINVLAFALLDEIGKLGSEQLSGHLGGGKCPESMGNDDGTEEPSNERDSEVTVVSM